MADEQAIQAGILLSAMLKHLDRDERKKAGAARRGLAELGIGVRVLRRRRRRKS